MNNPGGWTILLVLALLTLASALMPDWPDDAAAWLDRAGRVTGVAGLACLLLAGVISVRVPGLDRPFGGLSRLWKLHHGLGLSAFVLLLAHPPLMALAAWPRGVRALGDVLAPPVSDLAMWSGWLALVAMMVFLAPSFQLFGRPEYQRWKALHFLAGVALVGGVLHGLPLTRTLADPWPQLVWGGLGGLAVLVFVWRATLARPLLRRDYVVAHREEIMPRVVELSLRPADGRRLEYWPGQFVYFTALDATLEAGYGEEHPYTLSSAPGNREPHITIKSLGDSSSALQQVKEGSRARVDGPYGAFLPRRRRAHAQLWVGGGIGLTPFVSAVRAIRRGLSWGPVDLIYCVNDPSRACYLDEFRSLAEEWSDFRVHVHYFRDEGPLTADFVREHCPEAPTRSWYLCGPIPLVRLAHHHARTMGVRRGRIHSEAFDFL